MYLKAYDSFSESRSSIGKFLDFYNAVSAFERCGTTPVQAYFNELPSAWQPNPAELHLSTPASVQTLP